MCVEELMQAAATYFEHYYLAMLRRAQKYVDRIEDAEDVVSECWIKLIRNMPKLIQMNAQARSTYIMKSVQNEAVDFLRKRLRQPAALQEGIPYFSLRSNNCPDQVVESQEFIHEIIRFLPNHERKIISMYTLGYTTNEIATFLKISVSSVRVYKHRAQQRLNDYVRAIKKTVTE